MALSSEILQPVKTVLIGGYYGKNNTGDDAILRASIQALQTARPNLALIIVSNSPENTQKEYHLPAVAWRDLPALASAVRQADLVLIGGGGLFMDYWGLDEESYFRILHGGISTYGTLAFLSEAFGVPYVLHAVGVGPLNSDLARQHTRRIFAQAKMANLRDSNSLALLEQIGLAPLPAHIHLRADAVFTLQSGVEDQQKADSLRTELEIPADKPLLGISIRYWDRPVPPAEWLPALAQAIREFLAETGAHALLLPFQIDAEGCLTDDLHISRDLAQQINLPDRLHWPGQLPAVGVMQALIAGCDLLLGMRLHALLMAINTQTPAVGLAYDPKVSVLMKEAGFSHLTAALPVDAPALAHLLRQAWQERHDLARQAGLFHKDQQSRAQKGIAEILQILDDLPPCPEQDKLGDFLIARLAQLQKVDTELLQERAHAQNLSLELNEMLSRATLLRQRLDEIENSQTYRLSLKLQGWRNALIPPASSRESLLGLLRGKKPKRK